MVNFMLKNDGMEGQWSESILSSRLLQKPQPKTEP